VGIEVLLRDAVKCEDRIEYASRAVRALVRGVRKVG